MSVSGNDQPGVVARHASISSAGVPIKKRRFPSWDTTTPPQEQNTSDENRQSSPSQDSSLLNSSVVTTSPSKSDASKNHFRDVKKEKFPHSNSSSVSSVLENINLQKPILQETNINAGLGSADIVDSKDKVIKALNSEQENIQSQGGLHLAVNESSSVHLGKTVSGKQNIGGSVKLEPSTISKDSGLSLGTKEPHVLSLSGQRTEGTHKLPDFDPPSLSLSLSKEKCVSPSESSDVNSRVEDPLAHSNRSNWDLNTTMDAWEGSLDESSIPKTVVFDRLSGNDVIHDIKPSIGHPGIGNGRGKQILEAGEHRSNLRISSSSSQHYKSEDSLCLSLSNSFTQCNVMKDHPGSSTVAASPSILPNRKQPGVLTPAGNAIAVGRPFVKLEPCDESSKHEQVAVKERMGLSDARTVNRELIASPNARAASVLHTNPQKAVLSRPVKSEPVVDGDRESLRAVEPTSQESIGKNVQQENSSAVKAMLSQPKSSCCSVGLVSHSDQKLVSGDVLNSESSVAVQSEPQIDISILPVTCKSADQVAPESNSKHKEIKEPNAYPYPSTLTCTTVDAKSDDPETCKSNVMDDAPRDPRSEGSGSDDEKVYISNDMEEDSYGSDYESDGNKVPVVPTLAEQKKHGKDDEEYEDGEVRDPLAHAAAGGSRGDEVETKNVIPVECNVKDSVVFPGPGDSNITPVSAVVKDIETDNCAEMNEVHIKECVDTVANKKPDETEEGSSYSQQSLTGNPDAVDEKRPVEADNPIVQSERYDVKQECDQELASDGTLTEGQGGEKTVVQPADENIIDDKAEDNDSTLPMVGAPVNGTDAAKDSNSGGNRSRIINLPRGSNATSPYRTRPFTEESFGRERYADFDGEKFHQRRNRDEFYNDGPRKFLRDRNQGQPFRNSRQNYGRGRGRFYGRTDSRIEWESDSNFMSANNYGPADFRFRRQKRNPVGGEELECNGYLRTPDGDLVGSGRGRKPLSDELPSFRHPSSRRLSPGVRDVPATRGVPVLRRVPRNISPDRCAGEDGSDLVGLRHGENFVRGMADELRDPIFTRAQPPFEGLDSQFVRGDRNLHPGQKRAGPPRVRSKSPARSRTRSPGPWSSPRRRSPDGFNGVPEFRQRSSPVLFRMGRMRSPERPCFPDEMLGRRRGSPPFVTRPNEMRDIDAGRVHGHLRSVIPNRAPSDRVLPRNTRRFEGPEGRERTENDDYLGGGPLRAGRFPELGVDASGNDVRRNFGERRGGIVRPFRPGAGADGENFRCHIEDGPTRPFRLCPEPDSELIERDNLRDREFDRRIKNRAVIAPRRLRNIEDADGVAYRQGMGQVWNGDGFDEGSHVKRRRF